MEEPRMLGTERVVVGEQGIEKEGDNMRRLIAVATGLCWLISAAGMLHAQDGAVIDGAVIYDHDPSTQLGDRVFGTIVADMMHDHPGRCSHGGPDGYSHNCVVGKYDQSVPSELMVLYSIVYEGRDTNEYVFFVRPEAGAPSDVKLSCPP